MEEGSRKRWGYKLPVLITHLAIIAHLHTPVIGQTCGATETYEKVTRVTPDGVTSTPIHSDSGTTVTEQCLERCRDELNCGGFVLSYLREACYPINQQPPSPTPQILPSTPFTPHNINLSPVDEPSSYFQKICLRAQPCGKAWMLERVVGFEVAGFDDLVLENINDRLRCAELCLSEANLQCRSAEYDESIGVCRLSRQDRRTQPLSFRPASPSVHYIENQCAGIPTTQHCEYEELPQQDLRHPDAQLAARSKDECLQKCESEKSFNCRSFTWYEDAGVCQLSGDDMTSAGPSAIIPTPGASYYQRTTCLDLRLECGVDGMKVNLHTPEPFTGRLFSQDFPTSCTSRQKGRTDTALVIKFHDPECGVVDEGDGIYSNVVVVQHHPVIQRRGDRAIKLLCLFQTANKTVSDSFNFIVDSGIGSGIGIATGIVNATAPSPRIRLRIVDRDGRDINGARLGEELYLRIDLDDDSVYGILARNLVARSGDNQDSITLLDERGCPADPAIFPSLQPVPGSKSLQGKFEAFKFSEDQVVKFQVNVQFCLQECRPAQCGNIISHGRRRRRSRPLKGESSLVTLGGELTLVGGEVTLTREEDEEEEEEEEEGEEELDPDSVYHEMPLQKEIIVNSNSVKPLRRGLLPEETEAVRMAQLVCTSHEVLIAIVISALILQICIILIAIMCVYARKRKHTIESTEPSTTSGGSSGAPRISSPVMISRGGYRSPYTYSSQDTANTLKSLRTSLRD